MTEQEWLTSKDPYALLTWITSKCINPCGEIGTDGGPVYPDKVMSDRKLRLFCCGAWSIKDFTNKYGELAWVVSWRVDGRGNDCDSYEELVGAAMTWCVTDHYQTQIIALIRSLAGNPFRPLQVDKTWLTPQVMMLAEVAYKERNEDGTLDEGRLAVLSDLLEEVGCVGHHEWSSTVHGQTTAPCLNCRVEWASDKHREVGDNCLHPLLTGLRSSGPHYPGMDELDRILGKE